MQAPDEIRARLRGPVNSLPTIFTRDGELDHHGIRAAIDRTIANGGNVIMLTWGDSLISLLTDDEVRSGPPYCDRARGPPGRDHRL